MLFDMAESSEGTSRVPKRSAAVTRSFVAPYSRRLHRGALGELLDGRTVEGRYVRELELELTKHLGGHLSIPQKLLVDRVIKLLLQLQAFDAKILAGQWTDLDRRTYGALLNHFRLALRELGLKGTAQAKAIDLATYLDQHREIVGDPDKLPPRRAATRRPKQKPLRRPTG